MSSLILIEEEEQKKRNVYGTNNTEIKRIRYHIRMIPITIQKVAGMEGTLL